MSGHCTSCYCQYCKGCLYGCKHYKEDVVIRILYKVVLYKTKSFKETDAAIEDARKKMKAAEKKVPG